MDTPVDLHEAGAEDDGRPEATPALLQRARVRNLLGLVTPVANLGMFLVSPPAVRSFGVGAGVLLCGFGAWAVWRDHRAAAIAAFAVHGVFVVAGLIDPRHPEIAARAWLGFSRILGKVMGAIVLPAIYWLVVTPISLIVRLCGARPLAPLKDDAPTWWTKRKPPPPDRFKRQF